jgi:hypothetical protein
VLKGLLLQGKKSNQITKMQSFNFCIPNLSAFFSFAGIRGVIIATLKHAPNWQANSTLGEFCEV